MAKRVIKELTKQGKDLINTPETFIYAYSLVPRWCQAMLVCMCLIDFALLYWIIKNTLNK